MKTYPKSAARPGMISLSLTLLLALMGFLHLGSVAGSQDPPAADEDIIGIWKVHTLVDDEKYDHSLVKITREPGGRLSALSVDLKPSSLASIGIKEIRFKNGHFESIIPDWGNGRFVFEGRMRGGGNSIVDASDNQYKREWIRVEGADTISLLQAFESSYQAAENRKYIYDLPQQTEDGLVVAGLSEAGVDEKKITDLMNRILSGKYDDMHDLLIAKDGKLLLEEYFRVEGRIYGPAVSDFYRDRKHLMASATKSITSTLIGIAIEEGFIADVEVPVFEFFPEYADLVSEEKQRIRLKHVLTMTAGLGWDQSNDSPGDVIGMWETDDVIGYCLGKPVVADPGTEYNYSNGLSTVLGAVIKNASGMGADEFSGRYLFTPLGISDFDWSEYPDGTIDTDGSLALRPRDLVKIGQLFLQDGRWNGKQILSEEYIGKATKKYVQHTESRWYGYQWWETDFEAEGETIESFHAWGWGGQYLFIFPDLDLIVVSHAGNFEYESERYLFKMIGEYILPAVLAS